MAKTKTLTNRTSTTKREPNGDRETIIRTIRVPKLEVRPLQVTIEGTSTLVVHAWSKKARMEMLANQLGTPSKGKTPKDPVQDFKDCFYRLRDGRFGFPSVGIKDSAVDAANDVKLQKTMMRRAFHIFGELVPITAPPITEPLTDEDLQYMEQIQAEWKMGASMRSDPVRLPGTCDIRFRPQFPRWKIVFDLEYNSRTINPDQLVNLFNAGGFGVGIGEHRCEKGGEWGRYKVLSVK